MAIQITSMTGNARSAAGKYNGSSAATRMAGSPLKLFLAGSTLTLCSYRPEDIIGMIRGVFPDGRVVRKVEAFRQAYRAVGLGWLWRQPAGPGSTCFQIGATGCLPGTASPSGGFWAGMHAKPAPAPRPRRQKPMEAVEERSNLRVSLNCSVGCPSRHCAAGGAHYSKMNHRTPI